MEQRNAGYFRHSEGGENERVSSAEASRLQAQREAEKAGHRETPVAQEVKKMNWKEIRDGLMADIEALKASGETDAKTLQALAEKETTLKTAINIVGRA